MSPAFKKLESGYIVLFGYQRVNCHMIFGVKSEDFRCKARLVTGGHVTEPPATITYASVVSRETVGIALTLSTLNDLPVKLSDIQNACITEPIAEKIWTVLSQEFGEDAGRKAIVVKALYGLNSAGAYFWNHLADFMHHLGFLPCPAELYIWVKRVVRPEDGFDYYAYVLIYVEYVMVIHHNIESVLQRIYINFKLKPILIGDPVTLFGSQVGEDAT